MAMDLVPWTARDVREMCSHYAPEEVDVLARIAEYTEARLHQNVQGLIKLLSTGGAPDWNTVTRVFTGRRDNPTPWIKSKCIPALSSITSRSAEYVETPVVQEIVACLDICEREHVMGAIIGGAGRGKTFVSRDWQLGMKGAYYVDCPPHKSYTGFLREISRQIGVADNGGIDTLCDRIYQSLDSTNVLLIDEVARIMEDCDRPGSPNRMKLSFLQRLHDLHKMAIIFVATDIFEQSFHDPKLMKFLAQMDRRIIYSYEIPKVSQTEVFMIVRAFLPDVDLKRDKALLDEVKAGCSGPRGVGPMFIHLDSALLIADSHGQRLCSEHLAEAMKFARPERMNRGRVPA